MTKIRIHREIPSRASSPYLNSKPSYQWNRIPLNEYDADIWKHYCQKENYYAANRNFFEYNPEITPAVRKYYVNFIFKVAAECLLHREVAYMTLNYVDRYFSISIDFPKDDVELVCIVSILVASKIEEIYAPRIEKLLSLCNYEYTKAQFRKLELHIAMELGWKLSPPTPNYWLGVYLRNSVFLLHKSKTPKEFYELNFKPKIFALIMNLIDVAAHHPDYMVFSPSLLAASAFYLYRNSEDDLIYHCSGISPTNETDCVKFLCQFIEVPMDIAVNKALVSVEWKNRHNIQLYNAACAYLTLRCFSVQNKMAE